MTILEYFALYVTAGFVVTFAAMCRQILRGETELIEEMRLSYFVVASVIWPVILSVLIYKVINFCFERFKQKLIDSI